MVKNLIHPETGLLILVSCIIVSSLNCYIGYDGTNHTANCDGLNSSVCFAYTQNSSRIYNCYESDMCQNLMTNTSYGLEDVLCCNVSLCNGGISSLFPVGPVVEQHSTSNGPQMRAGAIFVFFFLSIVF